MEHEDVRISAIKRPLKKLRNLVKDPPPRARELVFEGFELALPQIRFTYRAGNATYVSFARLDLPATLLSRLNPREHHALFVNLGLSFVRGHFRLSDFATFRVACAALTPMQCALLQEMLSHSLGEFRYRAGLDPLRPVRVVSSGAAPLKPLAFRTGASKALLLNGGGKDSCVGAELLGGIGLPFTWLSAFPNAARRRVVERSGNPESYSLSTAISPDVAKDAAYAWGPSPYLYSICAAALIIATLTGHDYLVAGFEHSSDDPNLVYRGMPINHQSGKTSAFETFFNTFTASSVVTGVKLFSIARPFTDLRLAEMFSHSPRYFETFRSCNVAMGEDRWCNACHKCAFTYLALYPFLDREDLIRIFGADLFQSPVIRRHIMALTSASVKPWECVGTLEENRLALRYCLRKSPDLDFDERPHRRDLEKACADLDEAGAFTRNLGTFLTPHNIPAAFVGRLQALSEGMLGKTLARCAFIGGRK